MKSSLGLEHITLFNHPGVEWVDRRTFALTPGDHDTYCEKREYALELAGTAFVDFAELAARRLMPVDSEAIVICTDPGNYAIEVASLGSSCRLLIQVVTGGHGYGSESGRHNFTVFATGPRGSVIDFFVVLREKYGEARLATVTWWYATKNGNDHRTVPIEPPLPAHDEFYPWIEGGVGEYVERYLNNPASVLFLMGPPGTGKTSLLRRLIYDHRLAATITYDESLLQSDEMFVDFLCDPALGILVVEDADLMVGSRESEGNKLISRFLNVSDGLIKTSGKKIAFTTNLSDFRHVDSALVRSGRCFDALRFRALSRDEAARAATAAGVADPGRECTLAELFGRSSPAVELAKTGSDAALR